MTVSIHAEFKPSTDNRPENAKLPRATVEAFVRAISQHQNCEHNCLIEDNQFGYCAWEIPPQIVEQLTLELPELPEEAQLVLERGMAENRSLTFATNDDRAWGEEPQPTVSLHWDKIDEPNLEWCKNHAEHAFQQIDLDFKDGITIAAQELKNRCEEALAKFYNHDTYSLLKVAEYALRTQGPAANVEGY